MLRSKPDVKKTKIRAQCYAVKRCFLHGCRMVLTLLSTVFFWGGVASSIEAKEKKAPNILFIFTDDQSYDTIGAFGNPDVRTEHLDTLAKQGVVFNRHYNTTSICMASRASVMTGMYEYKTGSNFMHGALTREKWQASYPMLLKKANYRIGFAGKFGFGIMDKSLMENNFLTGGTEIEDAAKNDFHFWAGGPGQTSYKTTKNPTIARYAKKYPHSTLAYGAASVDFIRESVKQEQPFAMTVFYKAPHRPTTPDPQFNDVYKNTVFRKLPNFGREAGLHFAEHRRFGRQYPRFNEWGYNTEAGYQKAMRIYHQLIYGIDQSVGMILHALKEQGVADNTVIIFSSDNGYFNGSHGLGSKVLPYEEASRVPLIIYDPRQRKSDGMRYTNSVTGGVDITATILDLAGVKIPANYDGKSLLPIVENTKTQVRDSLPLIQVWGPDAIRSLAVTDHRYKYVYWYYKDEQHKLTPTEELYDLQNDPYELKNIVKEKKQQRILNRMRGLYDQYVAHWKAHTVTYNSYEEYGILFDRQVSWAVKQKVLEVKGIVMDDKE